MAGKQTHQFDLKLHHPNQKRPIPESNKHEAIHKFAELVAHHFKTDKQAIGNEEEHNDGK